MPSSKPTPFSFIDLAELREELNFIVNDIYSKLDFAMHLDGKGVMVDLEYGGLGRDLKALVGLLYVAGGVSGTLIPGTGLVANLSTGLLYLNVTTKGDLLVGIADKAMSRLPIGTANQVLSVGGAHATGLQWANGMLDTLLQANTLLKADVDHTPIELTVAASTIVGRGAAGAIEDLSPAQAKTVLAIQASDVAIPGGIGTPTYDDMQDFLNTTRSAGRLTGGAVTKGAGATVNITAMDGMIFTGSTLGTSPLIYFKMPAQTNILGTGAVPNLQDGAVNWIYIDYAAGTPVYKATTTRSTIDDYTMFAVGRVWVLGATVEVQSTGHSLYNKDRRAHNRLMLKYGNMDRVSGAVVSALTVGGASGQGVQTDAGSWYSANTSFTTGAKTAFKVWYKTGGVWTLSASLDTFDDAFAGAGVTVFTRYQNGADLATLTGLKYGIYWAFMCPEGDIYIVLGTDDYTNIGAAQAATVPALLPPYLVNWGRLIGRVICQKSAATHHSVESSWATQFTLSAATDHSSLANLAADDHTQYVLVNNTRMATGHYRYAAAMADTTIVTLPTITANYPAHGFIQCAHASTGAISESAEFEYGSDGNVSIIRGTANIEAGGATAGKISLGPVADANPVVIKNNLGGGVSVNVMITLWYG